MTEASVTQALLATFKARLPGDRVVLKTCDRFTKGIPDIYIADPHTWLEVKLLRRGDYLASCSDALQQLTMRRLWQQTKGRAWYVVYAVPSPREKHVSIYRPGELTKALWDYTAEGFNHAAVADFVLKGTA